MNLDIRPTVSDKRSARHGPWERLSPAPGNCFFSRSGRDSFAWERVSGRIWPGLTGFPLETLGPRCTTPFLPPF